MARGWLKQTRFSSIRSLTDLVEGVAGEPFVTVSRAVDAIIRNVLLRAIELVVAVTFRVRQYLKNEYLNSLLPNKVGRVLQRAGVNLVAIRRARVQGTERSSGEQH
jgi:hypothetical protein